MPGFGSNPFGVDPFGDWDWGKRVFFDLIPESYRVADPDNGDAHQKWAAVQARSFSDLRVKIRALGDLRDPQVSRTEFDETSTLVLGRRVFDLGAVEQRGVRGSVVGARVFTADRGHFTFADLGKILIVGASANALNNRQVTVASVLSSTQLVTDPPLEVDVGPLRWELRAKTDPTPDEITIEILAGDVEPIAPGWLISDGYAQFEVLNRSQFKTSTSERKLLTNREGFDGVVDTFGRLVSATAEFTQRDHGRRLVLAGSEVFENEGLFEITEVVNATTVVLDQTLAADAGPLFWGIRRRPELILRGPAIPTGIVEQAGAGATASVTAGVFEVPGGQFSALDVGKLFTIRADSDPENGTYTIASVNSSTNITLSAPVPTSVVEYYWEVRIATALGDETQVLAHAPSLLQYLAKDFGITADSREDAATQRRYVSSTSRWIGLKGSDAGYRFLGELTGFDITATHLFRVDQEIYLATPAAARYAVGEDVSTRYGSDGSLVLGGSGNVQLTSATGVFKITDVGQQIEISGSGSGNDGLRTIETFVNASTVEFRSVDTATLPDAADGALVWRAVRLYSANPPTLPVYDEINEEIARDNNPSWSPDLYCWDTDGSITAAVSITSVSPATASPFPIPYTLIGDGPWDMVAGLGVGKWKITDVMSTVYFLETVPTEYPETGAGRFGSDGSLVDLGPSLELTAPSAAFVVGDVGRRIRIGNSGSGNNNLYEITAYTSPTVVELTLGAILPDINDGALEWVVTRWQTQVVASAPPSTGSNTLEYVCASIPSCGYCGSNKVLIDGTTDQVLEDPFTRLFERLDQVRPAHVQFVKSVGVSTTARVRLTATVTTP